MITATENYLMGYASLNVEGQPMLVTDRWAMYPYNEYHYHQVIFKEDGSEVGKILTRSQARRIITGAHIPNVAEQRNLAVKYKLLIG